MTFMYDAAWPIPDGLRLIHLSPSSPDLGWTYPADLAMVGDPRSTLEALLARLADADPVRARALIDRARSEQGGRRRLLEERVRMESESSELLPMAAVHAIVAALPPETIVVDEAVTNDPYVRQFYEFREPGRFFYSRGGALGWGMGGALGVSLGLGGERVVCVVGDGSAMYSPQALWTAARQRLPVVFVVLANRRYLILRRFLQYMKGSAAATGEFVGMDLSPPTVDFVAISRALGVEASRVQRSNEIGDAVRAALESGAPSLIEVRLATTD
jgi:benzoylformate decarboxylase